MIDKDDELMTMFQTIVKNESRLQTEYMAKQREYLDELNNMKIKIQKGEEVDTKQLIALLQDSGVIDENGKLNERYNIKVSYNG